MTVIVHIETGLPASGKSTHAKSLGVLRFNLDDYRSMLWGDTPWNKENEAAAINAMIDGAKSAIKAGRDIVLDNTHLTDGLPKRYKKDFSPLGVTFKVHDFTNVTLEECILRDFARGTFFPNEVQVGEDVIRKLYKNYQGAIKNGWKLTDEWMNQNLYVPPALYVPNDEYENAFIVDLDGTTALNNGHRGNFDYFAVCDDERNHIVCNVIESLAKDGYHIVFVSGRDDSCYDDTMDWITDNIKIDESFELFMRKTGDSRPDNIVKSEIFDHHIRDYFYICGVFDDRDKVVEMWRSMGITCFQVAPGNF